jgi:hypothetical protein
MACCRKRDRTAHQESVVRISNCKGSVSGDGCRTILQPVALDHLRAPAKIMRCTLDFPKGVINVISSRSRALPLLPQNRALPSPLHQVAACNAASSAFRVGHSLRIAANFAQLPELLRRKADRPVEGSAPAPMVAVGASVAARPLTSDARRVSIRARMSNPRERGPREQRPPMTVEVDNALVVRLRPEAARRDVPVARLVRDLTTRSAKNQASSARSSMMAIPASRRPRIAPAVAAGAGGRRARAGARKAHPARLLLDTGWTPRRASRLNY